MLCLLCHTLDKNSICKPYNRPIPHSTSLGTNNSTRARLGWTFVFLSTLTLTGRHCLFVGTWERSIKQLELNIESQLCHMLNASSKITLNKHNTYSKGTQCHRQPTKFPFGWLDKLLFSYQVKCWAPSISQLGTSWAPCNFLHHRLGNHKQALYMYA